MSYIVAYYVLNYLNVSFSGLINSVGEERELLFLLLMVSVRRGFLFLLVLMIGCVIIVTIKSVGYCV